MCCNPRSVPRPAFLLKDQRQGHDVNLVSAREFTSRLRSSTGSRAVVMLHSSEACLGAVSDAKACTTEAESKNNVAVNYVPNQTVRDTEATIGVHVIVPK